MTKKIKILDFIPKSANLFALFQNEKNSVAFFEHFTEKNHVYCVSYLSSISYTARHHFFMNKKDALADFKNVVDILNR